MRKRIVQLWLIFILILALCPAAFAAEGEIVVLYTNDAHAYIDNHIGDGNEKALSYSKIAALKASEKNAILVDAGDHIQGTAYGSMDHGATVIHLMNAAGYDAATLGNHEFDYGMAGCMATISAAEYPYVSCNFMREVNSISQGTVLEPYTIVEAGGKRVAFVGIATPETIFSSTPARFQDERGAYLYGFADGGEGAELYAAVQSAIDAARSDGADYIIALGHLGVDMSSGPWTSRAVIANTSGLDAFIDGHSHTVIPSEKIPDKNGKEVVLTQTGSYLKHIGRLTISEDGHITSQLLTGEDLAELSPDAQTKAIEDEWIATVDSHLGEVIGYAEVVLDNFDAHGNRLVRRQSTNTGDFSADALYYFFDEMGLDVDIALTNGGGIRNEAVTGEITYITCKEIHSFGNVACLQTVTGQQLLDALEWGAREVSADGSAESGGFLHVSGMKFSINPAIPSTVQVGSNDVWAGAPTGAYRVSDVQVINKPTGLYEPLDLTASYNLAGYNYTLRDLGDGFAMFDGAVNILDFAAEDYMVLANYIQSFPVDKNTGLPTITAGSGYSDINGSGRITILDGEESSSRHEDGMYVVLPGDSLWKIAQEYYGDGNRWPALYDANSESIQDPNLIWVGQRLRIPD